MKFIIRYNAMHTKIRKLVNNIQAQARWVVSNGATRLDTT